MYYGFILMQSVVKEEESFKIDILVIEFLEVYSFYEIKQYLDESKSVIRRVYCGFLYEEYVRKCQENINSSK